MSVVTEAESGKQTQRYDTFICYAHDSRELARRIKKDMENHGRRFFRARSRQVFLDERMGLEPTLSQALIGRIDASDYLLHIASPAAATSRWVELELNYWFESRPDAKYRLMLVVADGVVDFDNPVGDLVPNNAIAPALRSRFAADDEPLYLDFRAYRTDTGSIPRREISKLVAYQEGSDFEQTHDEAERQQRRRNALYLTAAIVASIVAAAASIAFLLALAATSRANEEADRSAALALSLQSDQERNSNPALALALAAEAVVRSDPPQPGALQSLATSRVAVANQSLQAIGDPLEGGVDLGDMPVAFGPDVIAVASRGNRIRVWRPTAPGPILEAELAIPDPGLLNGLAYSPDGIWLVAYGSSTTVWRKVSGAYELVKSLSAAGVVNQVAFDTDREQLAVVVSGEMVEWWDLRGDQQSPVATYASTGYHVIAISDNGRYVLTSPDRVSPSGVVRFDGTGAWQETPVDLKRSAGIQPDYALNADGSQIRASNGLVWSRSESGYDLVTVPPNAAGTIEYTWSPDGRWAVAFNAFTRTVQIWDGEADPLDPISFLSRHEEGVNRFEFSGDSAVLAVEASDGTLEVWDLATKRALYVGALVNDAGRRWRFYMAPNASQLVGVNQDSVQIWDFTDRSDTLLTKLIRHIPIVHDATFDSTGRSLLTTSTFGAVYLWTETERQWRQETIGQVDLAQQALYLGDSDLIVTVDDENSANTDNESRIVRVWSPDTTGPRQEIVLDDVGRGDVVVSRDGLLAWGDDGGLLHTLDLRDDKRSASTYEVGRDGLRTIIFDPSGRFLAAASGDGAVVAVEIDTGTIHPVATVTELFPVDDTRTLYLDHLAFSPDGSDLLIATNEGGAIRRNWSEPGQLESVPGDDGIVASAFSPGGRLLAIARLSGAIELRASDGTLIDVLDHRVDGVDGLAFRDGGTVLTVISGGTIRLWLIADQGTVLLADVQTPGDQPAFSDDGRRVVLRDGERVLVLDDMLSTTVACDVAGHYVTADQLAARLDGDPRACTDLPVLS